MFKRCCLIISICLISGNAFAETESNINGNNNESENDRVKINLTQVVEEEKSDEALPWLNNSDSETSSETNEATSDANEINTAVDATEVIADSVPVDVSEMKSLLSIYYKDDQVIYGDNDKEKMLEVVNSYSSIENNNITLRAFVYAAAEDTISNVRRKGLKRAFEVRKYLLSNGVTEDKINVLVSTNIVEESMEDRIEVFLGTNS